MTDEKWFDLLENLSQKFELQKEKEELITKDDVGTEIINQIEKVTFESPVGKMLLVRTTRPAILDKKVHYSHTAGAKSLVEYILSPDEVTQKLEVFKETNGRWEEIDLKGGSFTF